LIQLLHNFLDRLHQLGALICAITQSLGGSLTFTPVAPHMSAEDLVVPSRWLLCSDGLTDMVGHEAIEQSMAAGDEEAVAALTISRSLSQA
jgi:serine/threonine protein phosphatase PrpC